MLPRRPRTGRWLAAAGSILFACAALVPEPRVSAQSMQPVQQSSRGILRVNVVGFEGRDGRALVALYDSESAWLELGRARQVRRLPIRAATLSVRFSDVTRGRDYAVSVVHDENRNDRMDMRWFPLPRPAEGAGASRNPRPSMGPPSWDSVRFRFDEDRLVVISMTY